MDSSASLSLTDKGIEEVKHRTCRLPIRKRSILLLLETPHAIEHLLQKTVLQPDEFKLEIENLMREGFVSMSAGGTPMSMPTHSTAKPSASAPQYSADPFAALAPPVPKSASAAAHPSLSPSGQVDFTLLEDIILSEAKYLLVDFCVDSFGTRSQSFADEIGSCRNADSFSVCLTKVFSETRTHCPERLSALTGVVKAINETA